MQILIANEQKTVRLDLKRVERLIKEILRILRVSSKSSLSVTFISRAKIRCLNRRYFKKDRVTDVIALGYKGALKSGGIYPDYLGDIVICPGVALENSRIYHNVFLEELTLYIIHGILHLQGYRDRTKNDKLKMQKIEKALLQRIM